LIYARDADPRNPVVLRLLTVAFWQSGNLPAAARAVRDWARVEGDRPTPHRVAARIYEDMGALGLAVDAAERTAAREPGEASAWERVGRLKLRRMDRSGALVALERARLIGATVEGLLDLALAFHLGGDVGGEVAACEAATQAAPEDAAAWGRYAHALARTDRVTDCLAACDRTLALANDPEVRELRDRVSAAVPRALAEPDAA
jgi:tetratricopeptide (TPR) repeat protein